MHPDEIEEIEYRFGPKLWDATPGVCCAAFQLGACPHTEGDYDAEMTDAELDEWLDYLAAEGLLGFHGPARPAPTSADEPF